MLQRFEAKHLGFWTHQHLSCNGTKRKVPVTWQRDPGQFQERCGVCDFLGVI